MIEVRWVRFGRDAARELRDRISAAQQGDPLAPVTVVVPRGSVGLAARRLLASGQLTTAAGGSAGPDDAAQGIAGVSFLLLRALAADLAAERLAVNGSVPLRDAVLYGAARKVLAETRRSLLGAVADHPSSVRALVATYRDLRGVSPENLEALIPRNTLAREVVGSIHRIRELLSFATDDVDVLETARAVVEERPAVALQVGTVILYLPGRLRAHEMAMLSALGGSTKLEIIVGLTGEPEVDEPMHHLFDAFEPGNSPRVPSEDGPLTDGGSSFGGDRDDGETRRQVLNASTADAEVLKVLREVLVRAESGTPFNQMAILHSGQPPYPRALHDALLRAEIPFYGSEIRRLSTTLVGRVLVGLMSLEDEDFSRKVVTSWFSSSPLFFKGRRIPATEWDVCSKRAGIVSGIGSWRERLDALGEGHEFHAEAGYPGGTNGEPKKLKEFMDWVAATLEDSPSSWSAWSQWARSALKDLLGTASQRTTWTPEEMEASTLIDEILEDIESLDAIETSPPLSAFRALLLAQLEAPAPGTSRFGHGILLGPVSDAVGLDLASVFILGMDDAHFPQSVTEDVLLPDPVRAAASRDIPLRQSHALDGRRAYLAVATAARDLTLSFARGDARKRAVARPSRWLLEQASKLAGRTEPFVSGDLDNLPAPGYTFLSSFTATVGRSEAASSRSDLDLRALLGFASTKGRLDRHPVVQGDAKLARGLRVADARRSARFGPYVGRAAATEKELVPGVMIGPMSPTSLEKYATCPRQYFFAHLLRLVRLKEPESTYTIDHLERGKLVHGILERYIAEELVSERDSGFEKEFASRIARIEVIAEEEFSRVESEGLTGRAAFWEVERSRMLRDLRSFVRHDLAMREESGARPTAVERRFGGDQSTCEVHLASGTRVSFHGKIDRVDVLPDGTTVVIDYKTGKVPPKPKKSATGPAMRLTARQLQLPIYGIGVGAGSGGAPVRADYWYVTAKEKFRRVEVPIDTKQLAQFAQTVEVLIDGVQRSHFPARPGPEGYGGFGGCTQCDFTSACSPNRRREWERLRNDPTLRDLAQLLDATESTGETGTESDDPAASDGT